MDQSYSEDGHIQEVLQHVSSLLLLCVFPLLGVVNNVVNIMT